MKKILLAAAMCAAFAAPPAFAADMAEAPASDDVKMGIKCFILPLLPDCIEYWKAMHEEEKAKWEAAKADFEGKVDEAMAN